MALCSGSPISGIDNEQRRFQEIRQTTTLDDFYRPWNVRDRQYGRAATLRVTLLSHEKCPGSESVRGLPNPSLTLGIGLAALGQFCRLSCGRLGAEIRGNSIARRETG